MIPFINIFRSKNNENIKLELPVTNHIPYACHFDEKTILTKNGELVQTIKITGFNEESIGSEDLDLRDMIRESIEKNIKTSNFSLWVNTIRRKRNLKPEGEYPDFFSYSLNKEWNERHKWNETLTNEVYITLVIDGSSLCIYNPRVFLSSLYFGIIKDRNLTYLKDALVEITEATFNILNDLHDFGARILEIKQEGNGYYSEPLQFISKVMNLAESKIHVPVTDISQYLATHKVAFGSNIMEVIGKTGKHFGASLTIKEYHEQSGETLDNLLQLPQEFIITQTIDFINYHKALKTFKEQEDIFKLGGNEAFMETSGLQDILNSDQGNSTDFGESQLSIFLINHEVEGLEEDVLRAIKTLRKLGIVAVRNDMRLEQSYWSQLPSNFSYLSNLRPLNTRRFAGMAFLFNFPAGKPIDNRWGPAAVIFHTDKETPYFFSFHVGQSGHTAILGPYGSGKTVLTNFMVSEALKFNCRLFFFDYEKASQVFIKSIGGDYKVIDPLVKNDDYAFNPFSIEDNEENRDFLVDWLELLSSYDGFEITNDHKDIFIDAIDACYKESENERNLSKIMHMFEGEIAGKLSIWHGDGKYAHLFDNKKGIPDLVNNNIYGFCMNHILQNKETLGPILSYLFHRIEMSLDGTPTIIVLDEAWKLINNPIFAPKIKNWLDRLTKKNAIVIFATENIADDSKTELTDIITNSIVTQIFLPNMDADKSQYAYKKVWGLNEEEFKKLRLMEKEKRQFMLSQDGNSVVAKLDLKGLKELEILSSDSKKVELMKEAIKDYGESSKFWLPAFYKAVKKAKN